MAKINWDHENTTVWQRILIIFVLTTPTGLMSLIIASQTYQLFHPIFWSWMIIFFVMMDIVAALWNRKSPWAPSEEEE